jgi:hypothetical protein
MKPISEMTLAELANAFEFYGYHSEADRLRAIHDLTRWIPVSERMPTKEDGLVRWYINKGKGGGTMNKRWSNVPYFATHWQHITPPTKEGE